MFLQYTPVNASIAPHTVLITKLQMIDVLFKKQAAVLVLVFYQFKNTWDSRVFLDPVKHVLLVF